MKPRPDQINETIERVLAFDRGPEGTHAYCDSGDALTDAKVLADHIEVLRSAIRMAIAAFAQLVDPDPNRGLITNVKLQGEQQGVDLSQTYDVVVDVADVLSREIGESQEDIDELTDRLEANSIANYMSEWRLTRALRRAQDAMVDALEQIVDADPGDLPSERIRELVTDALAGRRTAGCDQCGEERHITSSRQVCAACAARDNKLAGLQVELFEAVMAHEFSSFHGRGTPSTWPRVSTAAHNLMEFYR